MVESKGKERIGILGGTFDPVHRAHVELAQQALVQSELSKLIIIPCAQPPHRTHAQASDSQRLRMLELAFAGFETVEFCHYELNKPGLSYSVETLEHLREQYTESEFVFCLGEDSLRSFSHWHRWQDILAISHLAVMKRADQTAHNRDIDAELELRKVSSVQGLVKDAGQIIEIVAPQMRISATEIRAHIKVCISELKQDSLLNNWLPPEVLAYIADHKVYR